MPKGGVNAAIGWTFAKAGTGDAPCRCTVRLPAEPKPRYVNPAGQRCQTGTSTSISRRQMKQVAFGSRYVRFWRLDLRSDRPTSLLPCAQ